MKVLACYNIKGGVGKTTTAVNLAFLAALEGTRTLIWDLDPQAAATYYFRVKPKVKGGGKKLIKGKVAIESRIRGTDFDGLDLLPAEFSYRKMESALEQIAKPTKQLVHLLDPLGDEYDLVFLDCPPSISGLSESIFRVADVLLVPTIPTTLSLRTLEQLQRHLAKGGSRRPRLLPFFCMVDRRKSLHREICETRDENSSLFLETRIPNSSVVEHMGTRRSPLAVYAPMCEAARAYSALWREVGHHL